MHDCHVFGYVESHFSQNPVKAKNMWGAGVAFWSLRIPLLVKQLCSLKHSTIVWLAPHEAIIRYGYNSVPTEYSSCHNTAYLSLLGKRLG